MATLRATVILNRLSGKPEDAVRNVWHFSTGGGAIITNDLTAAFAGLDAFYAAVATRLSAVISRQTNVNFVEFARVERGSAGESDDAISSLIGRMPLTTLTGATSQDSLPSEVAAVLSFEGDQEDLKEEEAGGLIRPRARRRGRIYVGPLERSTTLDRDATTNETYLGANLRNAIATGYSNALIQWNGANAAARVVNHIVYSRTTALVHPVRRTWVDDAPDIVRSRGQKSVNRLSTARTPNALVP